MNMTSDELGMVYRAGYTLAIWHGSRCQNPYDVPRLREAWEQGRRDAVEDRRRDQENLYDFVSNCGFGWG